MTAVEISVIKHDGKTFADREALKAHYAGVIGNVLDLNVTLTPKQRLQLLEDIIDHRKLMAKVLTLDIESIDGFISNLWTK